MSVKTLSTSWPYMHLPANNYFEPWNEWFPNGFFKDINDPQDQFPEKRRLII